MLSFTTDELRILIPAAAAVLVAIVSSTVAVVTTRFSLRQQAVTTRETLEQQAQTTRQTIDQQAKATRETLEHQAMITQARLDHELTLARAERVQARIADVYVETLELAGWWMEYIDLTYPVFGPKPDPPELPGSELVRRAQARIGAHGSPEVKALLEEWAKARREFMAEADMLADIEARTNTGEVRPTDVRNTYGVTKHEQWRKVDDIRRGIHAILRRLEDQINEELRT